MYANFKTEINSIYGTEIWLSRKDVLVPLTFSWLTKHKIIIITNLVNNNYLFLHNIVVILTLVVQSFMPDNFGTFKTSS